MANENYIVINGKRAELTEEQLKQLGIEVKKASPFEKGNYRDVYYCIREDGEVTSCQEYYDDEGDDHFRIANYCTDYDLMHQRSLHEILDRLLWRYSMEHDGDKIDWSNSNKYKHQIMYSHKQRKFCVLSYMTTSVIGTVCFFTREIAESAIEEIVKPFTEAHPEFVW